MTPFDPTALLAMLLTFYPKVSGAELLRARRERPHYFAGAEIIGRHHDAMRLPDGRIFDLIFDVDGLPGRQRWQVIEVGDGSGAAANPFPLEPGPLEPIDEQQWPAPEFREEFVPIVAAALDELGASDAVLFGAEQRAIEGGGASRVGAALEGEIDRGDEALRQQFGQLAAAVPDDVLEQTAGRAGELDAGERDTEFSPPAMLPEDDPGPAPAPLPQDGFYDPVDRPYPEKAPIVD